MSYPIPRPNQVLSTSVDKNVLEARLWSSLNVPFTEIPAGPQVSLSDLVDGYLPTKLVDNSGTTGANTANSLQGRCAIAASGSSVVVTNSLCTATSVVLAVLQTHGDATAFNVAQVVPAAGSFTIYLNAAATGTCKIGWHVLS